MPADRQGPQIFTTACTRGFTLTLGTKALCDLESLADHALVDAIEDIGVIVYSLDPEIEHGDAEPRQFLRGSGFDLFFDLPRPGTGICAGS